MFFEHPRSLVPISGAVAKNSLAPLGLLGVLVLLLAWQSWRVWSATAWVEHTVVVQREARRVGNLLERMEAGQRGFLITKKSEFAAPYEAARGEIGPALGGLVSLVADNPPQQSLAKAIRAHEAAWDQNARYEMALKRTGDPGFLAYFEAAKGAHLMAGMRVDLERFVAREQALLNRRQAVQWRSAALTSLLALLALTLAITYVATIVRRRFAALDAAYVALHSRDLLLARAHDAILIREIGGRVTYWNEGATARYGYASDDVIDRTDLDAILQTRLPEPHEAIMRTLERVGRWEGVIHQRSKFSRDLVLEARWTLYQAPGVASLILENNHDVTERQAIQDALAEVDARFVAFMDYGPVFSAMKDDAGRYLYLNKPLARVFGIDADALIGKTVKAWLPEVAAERMALRDQAVISSGTPRRDTEAIPLPDGTLAQWLTFRFPFHSPKGATYLGVMAVDVTRLQQAEEALLEANEELQAANEQLLDQAENLQQVDGLKDEFLSMLSHELRTPINAVMGFASVLDDEVLGELTAEQHHYMRRILAGSDVMLSLINDLLDMSRMRAGMFHLSPAPMHFDQLAADVLASIGVLAEREHIALVNAVPSPLPVMTGDAQRVGQVLTNLVSNAIKFSPREGTVTVRARVTGDRLVCEVEDHGVGIAQEDLPRLFQRFGQLDTGNSRQAVGTGLGLAISKALVQAHGGEMGVRSELSQGSVFWFELPLSPI